MRYLKITSAENPDTDYIELNDFNGFLCTQFRTIGINREYEFLTVNNRRFSVDNKTSFKDYSLTIEILSKYSEYEIKHRYFITFLDRNKKGGFRLYYCPYEGMEERYCLCDIKSSVKTEKREPIVITVSQNSLWFGIQQYAETSQTEQEGNLFVFKEDEDVSGYYSAGFYLDEDTEDYCIAFYNGIETTAEIVNNCYNDIPLNIKIYGTCVNPVVSLFRKGENEPLKRLKVYANVDQNHHIEVDADILKNGIWLVANDNSSIIDYSEAIDNELGSPYFYIENGEYYVTVEDDGNNVCIAEISWKEEYSE